MFRQFLRIFALLGLMPLLLSAGVDRATPTMLETTEAVLATFAGGLAGCGTTNCSTCPSGQLVVQNPGGTDKGPYHNCIVTELGCSYHDCGFDPGGMAMVDELSRLLPTLDGSSLLRLQEGHDGLVLVVNPGRRAVQLLGCNGLVVRSIPLTASQTDQLI